MQQYTTTEQTAKLIELGFEPKQAPADGAWADDENYSIGELIEMVPPRIQGWDLSIDYDASWARWLVYYNPDTVSQATELVYALFNMIVKLKEKGVI